MSLWISNKYYMCECLFVALGIKQAMRMRHSVICSLPDSTVVNRDVLVNCVLFVSIVLFYVLFVCKCTPATGSEAHFN